MELVEEVKVPENQAVIYEPDIDKLVASIIQGSSEKELSEQVLAAEVVKQVVIIDLEPAIAQSRQTDTLFNINNTLSAQAHKEESLNFSIQAGIKSSNNLNQNVLAELNNQHSGQEFEEVHKHQEQSRQDKN
jgi:hypothetical protein